MKILLVLLIVLLCTAVYSQTGREQQYAKYKVTEYVTDETGTLRPKEIIKLKNKLQSFYEATSTQVVVLLIKSLDGDVIENAANEIFKLNHIGGKDKNNGVLLLVAKGERKIRIEVGYGLEGVLTDAKSKLIIKNDISPDLKKDDYYTGLDKGIDAIIAVTKGEYTAETKSPNKELSKEKGFFESDLFIVLSIIFAVIILPVVIIIILIKKGIKFSGSGGSSSGSSSGWSSGSSSDWSSSSSDSSSSSSDSGFSGGGGDSGGGGASGDY